MQRVLPSKGQSQRVLVNGCKIMNQRNIVAAVHCYRMPSVALLSLLCDCAPAWLLPPRPNGWLLLGGGHSRAHRALAGLGAAAWHPGLLGLWGLAAAAAAVDTRTPCAVGQWLVRAAAKVEMRMKTMEGEKARAIIMAIGSVVLMDTGPSKLPVLLGGL